MTVKELKKKLIGKINQTEDNDLLEEMYRLIDITEKDNSIYELSNEQLDAVAEGQLQFKSGQFLTADKADKDIEEWLYIAKNQKQLNCATKKNIPCLQMRLMCLIIFIHHSNK